MIDPVLSSHATDSGRRVSVRYDSGIYLPILRLSAPITAYRQASGCRPGCVPLYPRTTA